MPVHREQYDVHDPANVGAVLDAEDVEEVVEDVLQHCRPVQVLLTGDQNLRFIGVTRHLKFKVGIKTLGNVAMCTGGEEPEGIRTLMAGRWVLILASCNVLYSPRNSSGRLTRDSSPGISHSEAPAGSGEAGEGPFRRRSFRPRWGDGEGRDLPAEADEADS